VALAPGAPGADALRVRSVQVHGQPVPRALAGQRTAVNLPGVEPSAISRGQALTHQGVVPASSLLDAEVTLLAASPRALKHRARLLLHVGTAQVQAAVALLDRAELAPGATAPVAALPGQRFILRGFAKLDGRGATLAGGRLLSVASPRRRRGRREVLDQLAVLAGADLAQRVAALLVMAGPAGLTVEALSGRAAVSPKAAEEVLQRLGAKGGALLVDRERRTWVSTGTADELAGRLVRAVEAHHAREPLAAGMGKEALRGVLPPVADPRLFARLLTRLADAGTLVVQGDLVRRTTHRAAAAGGAGGAAKAKVAAALQRGGLTPPWLTELPAATGLAEAEVTAVLKLLLAEGTLVRVSAELWFDAAAVAGLQERLVSWIRAHGAITTGEFKELVGATRKHVIPLAEYFDRERVTLRVGERRQLRGEGR
jgi:selenocysteine-specific elongation factor